jgi:5-methylthioribose kinase
MEGKILTAETVPAYLEGHADKLQGIFATKDSKLKLNATAIQGGNVNYAFSVTEETLSRTVFLKQAPEFVAIFGPDGFPLTSKRMQQEMDVYAEWKTLLGDELSKKYLPTIHFFDSTLDLVML